MTCLNSDRPEGTKRTEQLQSGNAKIGVMTSAEGTLYLTTRKEYSLTSLSSPVGATPLRIRM